MPDVWFCIPSARPAAEANACLRRWRERGYKVAVFRDAEADEVEADRQFFCPYPGYAAAVNYLCRRVLQSHPDTEWLITGGDDCWPVPNRFPADIAHECSEHFSGTLGIMQPTGDRHMVDDTGRCAAERVCISPWMGAEWCRRGYAGRGPLDERFYHFFVDEHLHWVAEKLGILWHRPDLMQYHDWWGREKGLERPKFLEKAQMLWEEGKRIFEADRAAGFPGSEPVAAELCPT